MGMSLSTDYLLLDEEQYRKLKNKELYIKNKWTLELIDYNEYVLLKNNIYYNALKEYFRVNQGINFHYNDLGECYLESELFIQLENKDITLEEFIKESAYEFIEEDELPLSLDEFLEYNYCGEWIINELHEKFVNDKDCYLLIQTRYW